MEPDARTKARPANAAKDSAFDATCVLHKSDVYYDHLYCATHGRLIDPFASLVRACPGPRPGGPAR